MIPPLLSRVYFPERGSREREKEREGRREVGQLRGTRIEAKRKEGELTEPHDIS